MTMKIVTTEEMQAIEKAAVAGGLSPAAQLQTAGRRVAEAIDEWMGVEGRRVLVLVGPGNSGDIGLVAARHLLERAVIVQVVTWNREPDQDEIWQQAIEYGVPVLRTTQDPGLVQAKQYLDESDVVVDALLGGGSLLPIEGDLKKLLAAMGETFDRRRRPVDGPLCAPAEGLVATHRPTLVAIDVPSGLDANSGRLDAAAVPADMTVALTAAWRGHVTGGGPQACGKLVVADIGVPADLYAGINIELVTPARVAQLLPQRPASACKRDFGQALAVAGSVNQVGSPTLVAMAATRVGAGGVTVAVPQPIYPLVAAGLLEARYLLLPHDMGVVAPDASRVLQPELENHQAILIGPGLGREKATRTWLESFLGGQSSAEKHRVGFRHVPEDEIQEANMKLPPLIFDGDALDLLRNTENWWRVLPADSILILRPDEAANLLGCEPAEVDSDRFGRAVEAARSWQQVLVLTGACSLVVAPNGTVATMPFANPAMATSGSGDVLAGTILGLRAQAMPAYEAALAGAYLHGLAGELARHSLDQPGVIARDLLDYLPQTIGRLWGRL